MPNDDYPEVGEAASWLDDHWPTQEVGTEWYRVIDPYQLDMDHSCYCIAGQLGAAVARAEGYTIYDGSNLIRLGEETERTVSGWAAFTMDPVDITHSIVRRRERIERRGVPTRGDELSILNYEQELRLVEVLRKRLETDHIPRELSRAFDWDVPNVRWLQEIDRRILGESP